MVSTTSISFAAPADPRGSHAMVDETISNRGQAHDRIDLSKADDVVLGDITIGQKMLSAVTGSIFTSLLVTPLDVVRVRLQSQQQQRPSTLSELRSQGANPFPRSFNNLPSNLGVTACCREVFWVTNNAPYCVAGDSAIVSAINPTAGPTVNADCAIEESQRRTFTSTFDGMRKIARNEGITTLWRGLSPTLVMAVPGNVIYFAGYDWLRTSDLSPVKARISETYSPLVAGSSARVLAALCVSPIELFRTRMQATQGSNSTDHFRKTMSGIKDMVQNQGPRALWRGLTLTLWRDVPFSALYWWAYEATRNTITDYRDRAKGRLVDENAVLTRNRSGSRSRQNHSTTFIDSFAAGAISGALASIVTTPFDVGKTRQQVFRHAGDSSAPTAAAEQVITGESNSMLRLLSHIYKTEGVQGLFRGWAPRILKVAPACAIMISSYEIGKKLAQGSHNDEEEN